MISSLIMNSPVTVGITRRITYALLITVLLVILLRWSPLSQVFENDRNYNIEITKQQMGKQNCKFTNPKAWVKAPSLNQNTDIKAALCKDWILSPFTEPQRLKDPTRDHYSQLGQSKLVQQMYKQPKHNGFFIEVGALDGERFSNSLFFEKTLNWTGLLVEANPDFFKDLLAKQRHAYMLNACLSPKSEPMQLQFKLAGGIGGLSDFMDESHKKRIAHEKKETGIIDIQCFPLADILRAIGITHVDYFSLDIEGAELDVLTSFPFNEITVDILTVEYFIQGNGKETKMKLEKMKELMELKYDYREYKRIGITDIVFVKKSFSG